MLKNQNFPNIITQNDRLIIRGLGEELSRLSGSRERSSYSIPQAYKPFHGGCMNQGEFLVSYRVSAIMDDFFGNETAGAELEWTIFSALGRSERISPQQFTYEFLGRSSETCVGAFFFCDASDTVEFVLRESFGTTAWTLSDGSAGIMVLWWRNLPKNIPFYFSI